MTSIQITTKNEVSGKSSISLYHTNLCLESVQSVLDYLNSSDNNSRTAELADNSSTDLFEDFYAESISDCKHDGEFFEDAE